MFDIGLLEILFDPHFLATAAAAIFAFATFVTLGMPLLERDTLGQRLKSVAERREELRARHHAALNAKRGGLRAEPVGSTKLIKQIVERFNIAKLVESEDSREKLARAGLRGPTPLIVFMFFRFVMPFILFAAALLYLFFVTHFAWSGTVKLGAAVAAALLGILSAGSFCLEHYRPPSRIDHGCVSRCARLALDLHGIGYVDRIGLQQSQRRNRSSVLRIGRGVRAHHRRIVLSSRPQTGLR